MDTYPVLAIDGADPEREEPMGSKPKFWWRDADDRRWLFKYARPGTGEDWAEKLAAELARLLGLPCAHVELAHCDGRPGAAVLDFTDDQTELVHGNQLIARNDLSYPEHPQPPNRPVAQYTVERAMQSLGAPSIQVGALPDALGTAPVRATELFTGYLFLDAWIGNSDRHHENWGILERLRGANGRRSAILAPTYDHASSLGRELTDAKRAVALATRDPQQSVQAYAARARSAFFAEGATSRRPMSPLDALAVAARACPEAAQVWRARHARLTSSTLRAVIEAVPSTRMSDLARDFTLRLLICNGEAVQSRI